MAQKLKKYVIGLVIGLLIGLPIGVNIGKEKPIFSNPFAERSLGSQIKDKAQGAISDTKKALREKLKD
ncbi:MAG: hypothetical protein OEY67_11155 [Gammaproteobacteria bacterium]|nr:hypothetical protein [Gammaproteobacteria bacterium]